ncbi:MAG: site-specific DNA-methyltransferase [Thermoguttaceae bacterium]|nr:site-specific DNA-methyltransferase [Thermoguttaceae bacterium]
MRGLADNSIDLIYLDPPFFSQQQQALGSREGDSFVFEDRWSSLDVYLTYMKERLQECFRLLAPTGSLFLHCDSSASHYLRVLLDEIFGRKNFRSEIIWHYKRWSNSKKGLMNSHQTIFFYSKTEDFTFHRIYTEYSPTTNLDQILQDRCRDGSGKVMYKKDSEGNILSTSEKKGVPLSDVWEIPYLNPKAKERTGFPTQKPILLLERILEIASNPGDCVLDPFCGSGTALVAAKLMQRRFIGMDVLPKAIQLAEKRLQDLVKTNSELLEKGVTSYRTKSEEEKHILALLNCEIVQRNRGIDGIMRIRCQNQLVAVKIQKASESLLESAHLLLKAGRSKHCGFFILIQTHREQNLFPVEIPEEILVLDHYQLKIREYLNQEMAIL